VPENINIVAEVTKIVLILKLTTVFPKLFTYSSNFCKSRNWRGKISSYYLW